MSGLGLAFKSNIMNATLRNISFTLPASQYISLHTANPDTIGGEVNGGSYARQLCLFTEPANGVSTNSGAVQFATATADWGTITHIGIYDSVTAGTLIYWGEVNRVRPIYSGDTVKFNADGISIIYT